ncbi:alkaline phosphatase [Bremerella cremea]|uniref:Alkaline phosphatase n=1 Tax=Bremerella cremea TaxID=1031537 RepID=A0A368KP05_9BACT|nr:alkaline phosphatase D family protein [Bremerella cremea]RCS46110.1 alkaline phosphatase [Bremerella cremea]
MQTSRRNFLQGTVATAAMLGNVESFAAETNTPPIYQATGLRIGEVTSDSAIVWTRLTQQATRNNKGVVFTKRGKSEEAKNTPIASIEGACPGQPGKIRIVYWPEAETHQAISTAWENVDETGDFIHQFPLKGLRPQTTYHLRSETSVTDQPPHGALTGSFRTAPTPETPSPVRFCVMTCQGYPDRDHPDGHPIYPAMQAKDPDFISLTGDLVYYDNDAPSAMTADLARLHWQRMFSLPRLVETLRNTSTYWLKDDHDTLDDDAWPGQKYGEFTFAEGQKIYQQQAPSGSQSYRTFRWGQDLQIWLTDGRDFRSPNKMKDGPSKTIWGSEQKAWFKRTVAASDATWKVLISPTPLVGPDRPSKNDNHSNAGFSHEGNEIRQWLQKNVPNNFFVVCGDRHWQYHSVHPETGVNEFSVGAASNSHAGGTPGRNPQYHRFHKVQGGFLNVLVADHADRSSITFQLCDVDGKVSYERQFETDRTIPKGRA